MENHEYVKALILSALDKSSDLIALENKAKSLYEVKAKAIGQVIEFSGSAWKNEFLKQVRTTEHLLVTGPSCSGKSELSLQLTDPSRVKDPRGYIDGDASQAVAWKRRMGPWDSKKASAVFKSAEWAAEFMRITKLIVDANFGRCVIDLHFDPYVSKQVAEKGKTLLVTFPDIEHYIIHLIKRGIEPSEGGRMICEAWTYYLNIVNETRRVSQKRTFWLYRSADSYKLLDAMVAYEGTKSWASVDTLKMLLEDGLSMKVNNLMEEINKAVNEEVTHEA